MKQSDAAPGSLDQALAASPPDPRLLPQGKGGCCRRRCSNWWRRGSTGAWLNTAINSWPCFYRLGERPALCTGLSNPLPPSLPSDVTASGGEGRSELGVPAWSLQVPGECSVCSTCSSLITADNGAKAAGKIMSYVRTGGTFSPANLSFLLFLPAITLLFSLFSLSLSSFTHLPQRLCSLHLLPSSSPRPTCGTHYGEFGRGMHVLNHNLCLKVLDSASPLSGNAVNVPP